MIYDERLVALLALVALNYAQVLHAPVLTQTTPQATLMTAGDGSVFPPSGQGIAAHLASKGINIAVKKSAGSNEYLSAIDATATTIGIVLIGSAYDAINRALADIAKNNRRQTT